MPTEFIDLIEDPSGAWVCREEYLRRKGPDAHPAPVPYQQQRGAHVPVFNAEGARVFGEALIGYAILFGAIILLRGLIA